jgi:peptidoglycan/LPS O-acetylase OafA/YrhL
MTLLPQPGALAYDVSWTLEREIVFYVLAAIIVPLGGCRALAVVPASLGFAGLYFGNPWTFHLVSTTQFEFRAGVVALLIQDHTRASARLHRSSPASRFWSTPGHTTSPHRCPWHRASFCSE